MNIKTFPLLFLMLLFTSAYADDGSITINSPSNASTVSLNSKIQLEYVATLGSNGDHLHLYVDGSRVDILRKVQGNTELDALPPGKHRICLTINTKSHAPTGVEKCIEVTAQ